MAVTRGLDILVHIGTNAVGGQKGCTLTMEADTIDTSNKNDFADAAAEVAMKMQTEMKTILDGIH